MNLTDTQIHVLIQIHTCVKINVYENMNTKKLWIMNYICKSTHKDIYLFTQVNTHTHTWTLKYKHTHPHTYTNMYTIHTIAHHHNFIFISSVLFFTPNEKVETG